MVDGWTGGPFESREVGRGPNGHLNLDGRRAGRRSRRAEAECLNNKIDAAAISKLGTTFLDTWGTGSGFFRDSRVIAWFSLAPGVFSWCQHQKKPDKNESRVRTDFHPMRSRLQGVPSSEDQSEKHVHSGRIERPDPDEPQ